VFLASMTQRGDPLNIGHRQFPRDATEKNSTASFLTPVSVCHPARTHAGRLAQPVLFWRPGHPSGQRNPYPRRTRRRAVPQTFLESPADFVTRAPNLIKLGQADRASQDLVWMG